MRILLVNAHGTDTSQGGAERYVAALARALLDRGHELGMLAAFPGAQSVAIPTTVLHRTSWKDNRSRRIRTHVAAVTARPTSDLAEAVRRARPHVVHTHNLPGITTAVWEAARRADVPVVHCLHDYHLLCPRVTLMRPDGSPCRPHPLLCGLRARRLGRWAGAVTHVHGPSAYILDRHSELFGGAPSTVIRHPQRQAPGRELAPPGNTLRTIGFIGALDRTKGADVLLQALPALERVGVQVRVAGEGRLRAATEAKAGTSYAGTVSGEAKDDFLERCDLGLVPSVWAEPAGPPYTLLEWLTAGRPVISSRRGGLAESADLPGVHAIEPTARDLVATVERLREPDAWQRALAAVRIFRAAPEDAGRWIDEHEALLEEAAG
jgi:glycogen synthase